MCAWVVENLGPAVPMHFSAFHPDYRMLDKPRTPPETLATARRVALRNGVRYAYVGNVHDFGRQSTYCHACGERTIGRDWYALSDWRLDDKGACSACGTPTAGVFAGPPGHLGSQAPAGDAGRPPQALSSDPAILPALRSARHPDGVACRRVSRDQPASCDGSQR